ncbi:MAG: DMT family transporter [Ignavibacteriae bacterium]|nr:DMT family transporter [Ignavibacteriota bacterium]
MSKQPKAEFLLFLTTFVWGSTFVVVKGSLDDASPLFFITLRFLLSSAILFLIFYKKIRSMTTSVLKSGIILGLFLYFGFAVQTVGLQYTTASKSAFFTGMLVVFTPIVQFFVEKRLPMLGNIMGVILSAVGLFLLTSPEGSAFNIGDALTLLCAVSFGFYIVYLDVVSQRDDRDILTFMQLFVCAILGITSALLFEDIRFSYNSDLISSLLYLTIFATILTTWIQNRFQGDTTPTRAAVIFTLEPVIAATFAYYVRDEVLGTVGLIGAAIIIIGLFVSEFSGFIPFLNKNLGK